MSNYGILNADIATMIRGKRGALSVSPHGHYSGIELSDERMRHFYGVYVGLLIEEYADQLKENINE